MMGEFHFLRPWWLSAILPLLLLAWLIHRQSDAGRPWRGVVADHLLPYLLKGDVVKKRYGPVLSLATGWVIGSLALAGPTWERERSPFADDIAALAIVVKVSPSMETEDVAPSRLTRSIEKIHDLLEQRKGAKAALIAYAGTAHVVMPPTTDAGIIETFAQSLDPKIMPEGGGDGADAALTLAQQSLKDEGNGSILWITDGIPNEKLDVLTRWKKSADIPVHILAPLLEDSPELSALRDAAKTMNARVLVISPDTSDVAELAKEAKFTSASGAGTGNRWRECGYWLTPLIVILMLPFFRDGWMAPTAARS